jgi:Domain of unknown function (DUF4336)
MQPTQLNQVAENLWELDRPLKVPGLSIGHRMTVVRLCNGDLWVHSPIELERWLPNALAQLGPVRHLIAPNLHHDMYWPEWRGAFPEAAFYCPPGFREEHPDLNFQRVLAPDLAEPWEDELPKVFIAGMPRVNEFVFLHRATRTLIVADLVFDLQSQHQNALGKLFLKWNGISDRVACSRLFRWFIKDRAAFRQSVTRVGEWDFDRLVPGHGAIVTDGKRALQAAMRWLDG